MRWFRSRRLAVTWLALIALTCQFAHTFGHIHLDRFADHGLAIASNFAIADATERVAPRSSRQHDHDGPIRLRDGFCAICASISLAGAVLLPGSPTVLVRDPSVSEPAWPDLPAAVASAAHSHFDARGPPSA